MKKLLYYNIVKILFNFVYYFSLIILPLSVAVFLPLYSPFTLLKSAWLYLLGGIYLLLFLLILKIDKSKYQEFFQFSFWSQLLPVWLFIVVLLFLNIFSLNPIQSFFGSYERQMGVLFYLTLFGYFIINVTRWSSLGEELDRAWLKWQQGVFYSAIFISVSATLVAIYAICQFFGFDIIVWQEKQLLNRSISTLGQPNFLASFLLFGLAMSSYLLTRYHKFFWRFIIILSLILQLAALIMSGSRSAWLALIITTSLTLIIALWCRYRWRSLILAGVGVIMLVILLFFSSSQRLLSMSNWQAGSLGLRLSFYQVAPSLLIDNFFLGTGLENGGEVIVSQYQPEWAVFMKVNGYTDKLHNSLIDSFLQLGIFGFLAYLLLYVYIIFKWYRLYRHQPARSFAIAAGGAMLAYSLSLLFGLADIVNVFYFWVLAALMIAANLILTKENKNISAWQKIFKNFIFKARLSRVAKYASYVVVGVLIIFSLSQIYLAFNTVATDHYFLKLYQASLNREYTTAALLNEYINETWRQPVYLLYYQRAYAAFIKDEINNPQLDLFTSRLLQQRAKLILSQLNLKHYEDLYTYYQISCSLNKSEDLDKMAFRLENMSPHRPVVFIAQGDCRLANDPAMAKTFYNQALSFLPSLNDARLLGEHEIYLRFYYSFVYRRLAEADLLLSDYIAARAHYLVAYQVYPEDVSILRSLAFSSFKLGNSDEAWSYLDQAFKREPTAYWLLQKAALAKEQNDWEKAEEYWRQAANLIDVDLLPSLESLNF